MKKITRQDRPQLALAALLFAVVILLSVNHQQLPFARWIQHVILRTPVNLTAVPISSINKSMTIIRTGTTITATSVPVNAAFYSHVTEIFVTEGQLVKAGQALFKLQPVPDPANQRTGTSQQRQANYDNALKEHTRYQKLYEIGAIPRRQLDIATTQLQEAKANLTNKQNSIQSSTITSPAITQAPIGGTVTGLSTAAGKTVRSGEQLLSLSSGHAVEIVVRLDQNELYLVHLGTPAAIEVSQETIAGHASRIYPQTDPNQSPTFLAHITLSKSPVSLLKPGMSVNVHIDTGKSAIISVIPTAAIFQDDQNRMLIYIAENGKAVLQEISVGETIGEFTEITSSLPPQSMVITSHLHTITDGTAVTVIQ